jgi:hypothetical protein
VEGEKWKVKSKKWKMENEKYKEKLKRLKNNRITEKTNVACKFFFSIL